MKFKRLLQECFVCHSRLNDKAHETENGFKICGLCYKAWLDEGVPLGQISRSKIKDGFEILI